MCRRCSMSGCLPLGLHVNMNRNVRAPFHMFIYPCAAPNPDRISVLPKQLRPSWSIVWTTLREGLVFLQNPSVFVLFKERLFCRLAQMGLLCLQLASVRNIEQYWLELCCTFSLWRNKALKNCVANAINRWCNDPETGTMELLSKERAASRVRNMGCPWLPSCLDRWDLLSLYLLYQQVPWLILHFQTWKLPLDATRTPVSLGFHCGLDLHFVRIDFLGFWARSLID